MKDAAKKVPVAHVCTECMCVCIVWWSALPNKVHSDVLACSLVEGQTTHDLTPYSAPLFSFYWFICVLVCSCVSVTTETDMLSWLLTLCSFPIIFFLCFRINQNNFRLGFKYHMFFSSNTVELINYKRMGRSLFWTHILSLWCNICFLCQTLRYL